jgi:hypothetical protein
MAVKFSDFTPETVAANITDIVGYTTSGSLNVRIPPANLDTTYSLGASGSTDVVLTLGATKPGSTATDTSVTITKGSGISFSSISTTGFTISASGAVTTVSAIAPGTPSTGNPLIVTPTTGDVEIQSMAFAGGSFVGHVPSAAAASAGQFLDYTGNWSAPAGAFTGFTVTGDLGSEGVANGDTVQFTGGTFISTQVASGGATTDIVTIDLDTGVALWRLVGGDDAGPIQSITPGNDVTIKENTSTVVPVGTGVQVGGGVQALAANTDELLLDQKSEQVITVAGSVYVVDGASRPTIVLPRGFTYEFNQDDSSNNSHPLVIGTSVASNPYATGIQYYGSTSANTLTPVAQNVYENTTNFNSYATRRVRLRITQNTPALYYYCSVHGQSYGGSIAYGGATGLATMTTSPAATGNGSTATYPLGATPTDKNYTMAYISGVYQLKSSYSVSGSDIIFDTNVPNGASIEIITTT